MSKRKSIDHYLGINESKKLNCAQAVIAGFKDKFSIGDETLAAFSSFGGGKAPDGYCGALYAARHILEKERLGEIEKCNETFIKAAGSTKCKEIRNLKKLSCVGCVEKAAEILDRIQEDV